MLERLIHKVRLMRYHYHEWQSKRLFLKLIGATRYYDTDSVKDRLEVTMNDSKDL